MLRKLLSVAAICFLLFLSSCVRQEITLTYIPQNEEDENSTTPAPITIELPEITGIPFMQDNNGIPIIDDKTHYADTYLNFSEIRVYDYHDSTLMDGICINNYNVALTGGIRVCFYDEEGKLCGTGEVTTAESKFRLIPGENRIYATIYSDGDVKLADIRFEVSSPVLPETKR